MASLGIMLMILFIFIFSLPLQLFQQLPFFDGHMAGSFGKVQPSKHQGEYKIKQPATPSLGDRWWCEKVCHR